MFDRKKAPKRDRQTAAAALVRKAAEDLGNAVDEARDQGLHVSLELTHPKGQLGTPRPGSGTLEVSVARIEGL